MKTILVGLDGSPRAPYVLSSAIAIARANGGKLILFRAIGLPAEIPQDLWKTTDEPLLEGLQRHARDYLTEQAAQVPPDLLEKTEVEVGVPWVSLCEWAKRDQADLILVGSHGYSGLDHVIGTTAAKVVNHAQCSVLVVRDPARRSR
jgi:universal stress protein F